MILTISVLLVLAGVVCIRHGNTLDKRPTRLGLSIGLQCVACAGLFYDYGVLAGVIIFLATLSTVGMVYPFFIAANKQGQD